MGFSASHDRSGTNMSAAERTLFQKSLEIESGEKSCQSGHTTVAQMDSISEHRGNVIPNAVSAAGFHRWANKMSCMKPAECCEKVAIDLMQKQIEDMRFDLGERELELELAQERYAWACEARVIQAFMRRKQNRLAYLEARLRMRRYLKRLSPQLK